MALPADPVRRVGAAQRDILINGDVVANFRGFADHGEAMLDEEPRADLRTRMNVDRGQHARQMVDATGQEIEFPSVEPVRDAVEGQGPYPGIDQDFPARSRRRIARLDRIEIGQKMRCHAPRSFDHSPPDLGRARRLEKPDGPKPAPDRLAATQHLRHAGRAQQGGDHAFSMPSSPIRPPCCRSSSSASRRRWSMARWEWRSARFRARC